MKPSKSTTIKIVEAAIDIIATENLASLSFDRLVKKTGVSKGGILYHFANKEALLLSILNHIDSVFVEKYQTSLGNQPPHPGRAVLAYLSYALESHLDDRLYATLVAISIEQPELVTKQGNIYKILKHDTRADGGDFARQWVLVAALDSLWTDYNSHIYGLRESEHAEIGKFLLNEARTIVTEAKPK